MLFFSRRLLRHPCTTINHLFSAHILEAPIGLHSRTAVHIVSTMPKNVDMSEMRQARSVKKQKLKSFGPPCLVKLQFLGSGAPGAPRALYVFTTSSSYLFNCGEGTQRLSHEYKTRLSRLENVFVTTNLWRNVGGIPGALLTLCDIGLPQITLHGPPGLSSLYNDTRNFIQLRGMKVAHRRDINQDFVDSGLTVRAVPLWGASLVRTSPAPSQPAHPPSAAEQLDFYAFERTGRGQPDGRQPIKPRPRSPVGEEPGFDRAVSYAYLCSVPDRPGKLLLEKCVELGVKPGPMLGKLKNGEDIRLDDGRVVRSCDVTSPDEVGQQFLVLDVPSPDFLPSLADLDSSIDPDRLAAVVHFAPPAVVDLPGYRAWTVRLPASVRHFVLNENNRGHGSEGAHRLQYQLNAIDDVIFPLLAADDVVEGNGKESLSENSVASLVPVCKRARLSPESNGVAGERAGEPADRKKTEDGSRPESDENSTGKNQEQDLKRNVGEKMDRTEELRTVSAGAPELVTRGVGAAGEVVTFSTDGPLIYPRPGCGFSLRPAADQPDSEGVMPVTPSAYVAELAAVETFTERRDEYRRSVAALPQSADGRKYPRTVFLGTGSSIPNKKRNTSGILINLSEDRSVLLDCGEGTYGQLVRLYGNQSADQILRQLSFIYISHLHADHHIGLISILENRRRALGSAHRPCLLLAPRPISHYLHMYHRQMSPLTDTFTLVDNATLLTGPGRPASPSGPDPAGHRHQLLALGFRDVTTCYVRHCPHSFGVRLDHQDGWSLVYSGDTRPCDELVELGHGCDLLIHEATHEDELQEEAELRAHSTTSEAIDVGRRMGAGHVVLTHFSQRYSNLPLLPDTRPQNVGVAYDNMVMDFCNLPRLPLIYPVLRVAFSEYYDICVERTAKRKDRKERLTAAAATAQQLSNT